MKDRYDFSSGKRGAIAPNKGKTRITIMLDDSVLEAARTRADEQGIGYQTLINAVLKKQLIEVEAEPASTYDFCTLRDEIHKMRALIEEMTPPKALAAAVQAQRELIYPTPRLGHSADTWKRASGYVNLGPPPSQASVRVLLVKDDPQYGLTIFEPMAHDPSHATENVAWNDDFRITIDHLVAKDAR
mgnify:CR=1 FL=1